MTTTTGIGVSAASSEVRVETLRAQIVQALNGYNAATGDTSCWPFTVDAIVFLSEWLSRANPVATRAFLEAIAQRGTDQDFQAIVERTDAILSARANLIKELTDYRRFS